MDKKSFFRGFGVGVLFASLVLGISFMVRTSDSFTKQRALELGMVYESSGDSETVLSSEKEGSDKKQAEELAEEKSGSSGKKSKKNTQETNPPKASDSGEKKQTSKNETSGDNKNVDMNKEKEKLEKNLRSEQQSLTINAGEWSTQVANKLEYMGIIDDAAAFDKYLDKNGFSSFISAGTYQVSSTDTYQELAKKITGQ